MSRQKKRLAGLERRKAIAGYMFIMPFIVGFLAFMAKPLVHSFYMSFCSVEADTGKMTWTGLTNLKWAFGIDPDYTRMLTEEIGRMLIYCVAIMVFSFFVALILNQKFKGRAFVRAVFFLPVILSSGVMLGLETDNSLMDSLQQTVKAAGEASGVSITATLEEILRTTGVGVRAFEKVFEIMDNIYDVAIASGIQIIIYLSGLQTISESMYEAADIEGCTKWESLWKITFPMISSLFLVNWIYTVIDFCMRSDNELIDKIDVMMRQNFNYGYASVMSWAYFVVIIVIIGVSSLIISRRVYYYE